MDEGKLKGKSRLRVNNTESEVKVKMKNETERYIYSRIISEDTRTVLNNLSSHGNTTR